MSQVKSESGVPQLLPDYAQPRHSASSWQPKKYLQPPNPPPVDEGQVRDQEAAAQKQLLDGKALKKTRPRRTVDYAGGMGRWALMRKLRTNPRYLLPPKAYPTNASTSLCTKFVHTSTNKIRCPVNVVTWTPEGRRVLTGSTSGEFTLWNGLTFNFETILQAHDSAIRAVKFSHSENYIASADQSGIVKYFQPNMNNLAAFQAHREAVRGLSFSPDDGRFATASDDSTVRLWAFEESREERVLTGHGWDVKCVEWHPTKGLLVSGSKDNLVKFWDPRTGTCLSTFHQHKNTVQALAWSPNGDLVASASRDQTIRVFDIRAMKEYRILKGHKKEVCSVTWHPFHPLLVSGGSEGSILHWDLSAPASSFNDVLSSIQPGPRATISEAHDSNVWSLAFHPLGHLLVSGSNDHTTRFWSRERPGDASAVFTAGGEKPPAAPEGGGQDDEEEMVPGFPGWGGEDDAQAYGAEMQDGYVGGGYRMEDGIPGIPGLGGGGGGLANGPPRQMGMGHGPLPSQTDMLRQQPQQQGGGMGGGSGRWGPPRGGKHF
ncbi:WD40-repeat-containing domain protein [Hysterangium stoloniferum]|nr:WD40-repeat-containing domain protein [Hysterangium stoloniferum]